MTIRVRFAPSPTGYLHIGGARTALFNWLLARRHRGAFILRIEDTDLERSSPEMVEGILEGLKWLKLDWDEGPYYQSQRLELHRSVARRLLQTRHAYRCFCPPELLEKKKQMTLQAGKPWQYDRTCRELSPAEVEKRVRNNESFALRFKVPGGHRVSFEDTVYGPIEVETENIEDFVILRSDSMPTYHLCVVADDLDMRISHVVRGADHLPNTSKHVLIYQALGEPLPIYAHLPLILGPDKKRLSKRHGATSVLEYRQQGFLAAAVANYLALLGWSPGTDEEIFAEEELIRLFDLKRINKANAVFDPQKLEWMSGQYISRLRAEEFEPEVKSVLQKNGLWNPVWEDEGRNWFLKTIDLLKPRIRKLTEFATFGRAFFSDDFDYEAQAVQKYLSADGQSAALKNALGHLQEAYDKLDDFSLETTEKVLREIGEKHGVKSGKFIGAVRLLLTGRSVAPGIFEVMVTLGKEKTCRRLQLGLRLLQ